MNELKKSLEIRQKYNQMDIDEFIIHLEKYLGKELPEKDKENFKYSGLNNVDLFTMHVDLHENDKVDNMSACLLSIFDTLKLYDNDSLISFDQTLSEKMFNIMKHYNIDLEKELDINLKPVTK